MHTHTYFVVRRDVTSTCVLFYRWYNLNANNIRKMVHMFQSFQCLEFYSIFQLKMLILKLLDNHHHHHHHHHHVVPLARISLVLSRHFSLSFIASGRSSGLYPVSSHSCWMYVWAGRPAFPGQMWGSIGVHHLWARPCFSSSVLHVWIV